MKQDSHSVVAKGIDKNEIKLVIGRGTYGYDNKHAEERRLAMNKYINTLCKEREDKWRMYRECANDDLRMKWE